MANASTHGSVRQPRAPAGQEHSAAPSDCFSDVHGLLTNRGVGGNSR